MAVGSIATVATGGQLRLTSISDVRGVKALRSDVILKVEQRVWAPRPGDDNPYVSEIIAQAIESSHTQQVKR